jgi:hypothetical protein
MASPVKVADPLFEQARETASLANRSIAKQIEHWAQLGRAVERLVSASDALAFKAQLAAPQDARKLAQAHAALERLARSLADSADRKAARRLILDTGEPIYEAVRDRPDLVAQVRPDGRRLRGRFVGEEFVPEKRARKKRARAR